VVYFAHHPGKGLIKIGYSKDPRRRIFDLRAKHKERIELIAVMPGSRIIERFLHHKFHKLRMEGEWFSPSPELLKIADKASQFTMDKSIPSKIMIPITPDAYRILAALAKREKRDPRAQAALLIRRGLGLDGSTVKLSPMSTTVLTQIAKDEGLNGVEEALEFLVMNAVLQDDQLP
jgi:hypothetical protein